MFPILGLVLLLLCTIQYGSSTSSNKSFSDSGLEFSSPLQTAAQAQTIGPGNAQFEVCGSEVSAFNGNVMCVKNFSLVFIGHCFDFIDSNLSKSLAVKHQGFVLTRCPFYAGSKTNHLFKSVPPMRDNASFNNQFCKQINGSHRKGLLCKQCEDSFGVNVLSPSYECKNCTKNQSLALTYLKLFASTFLPLTVFFLIVIIFHIGLTAAPINAYVLFSHILSLKLNVLIIETAWANTDYRNGKFLSQLLLYPLYIWNLDFAYYNGEAACFGEEELKIMYIIAMKYLYAFYPLLLLLVTFVLLKLHGRNCKPVVLLWKPFCYLCVRLRRNWNVRTSLVDAFASFMLLSYSKLMDVSLALVNPNPVYNKNGETVYFTLHYDIETRFLSKEHLPLFILAVVTLLLFGLLPPVLLMVYPFRWFQKILNTLRLNRVQCLYIFVDAFQGCYKNGTNGSPERRYFAGFYFIFRLIVIFVNSFGNVSIQGAVAIQTAINALFLCVIAVFQPYKKNFYNAIDACTFLVMIIANSNTLYIMSFAQLQDKLPDGVWTFTYTVLLLPTLYVVLYIVYWILTHFRAQCCHRWFMRRLRRNWRFYTGNDWQYQPLLEHSGMGDQATPQQHAYLDNLTESLPDRLNNPYRYSTRNNAHFRDRNCSVIDEQLNREREELTHYGAATH